MESIPWATSRRQAEQHAATIKQHWIDRGWPKIRAEVIQHEAIGWTTKTNIGFTGYPPR